jgi:histidine ammonia-lyase
MPHTNHHSISPDLLTLDDLQQTLTQNRPLALSDEARTRIERCHTFLQQKIQDSDEALYGINTGFGSLCNVRISNADLEQLQYNLVRSHAVGTGDLAPAEVVKIMLLLKIQSLSYGHSAVKLSLVERLIDMYNADVLPVVYELGSLGASGDLAPLAHLSLPLIGEGEVWYKNQRRRAADVLHELGWAPLTFAAKEALALLNGTQFSTAYTVWCLLESRRLLAQADLNAALGYDAFGCQLSPLDTHIHQVRPHAGQVFVAKNILNWLKNSELANSKKESVQDPYAFRCVPQVHGATRGAFDYIEQTVLTEINSVTDNPNVFPDEGLIVSGGNFHAQPIALAADHLALALSEIGSIAERRVFQLISGQRGLPPFLTPQPGLHSGLMIAQYTAAAIASQNKTYCTPASADSIVSSNGQEDHVSMAANAATKARRVVLNVERLLAIEWMCAAQALEFRRPGRTSAALEHLHSAYREVVPKLTDDRILSDDLAQTVAFLKTIDAVNNAA